MKDYTVPSLLITKGFSMTRRQKKSPEERRAQILTAAETLFATQGFARTTTKEIARAAEISEGTIYKYFESKQQILIAMVSKMIEPLMELFAPQQDVDDAAILKTFIRGQFEHFDRNKMLMQIMFSEIRLHSDLMTDFYQAVARPALQVLEQYITRRIEAGAFRPVHPAVAVRSLLGTVRFYTLIWEGMLGGQLDAIPREVVIEEITTLFLRGLQRDPERIDGVME